MLHKLPGCAEQTVVPRGGATWSDSVCCADPHAHTLDTPLHLPACRLICSSCWHLCAASFPLTLARMGHKASRARDTSSGVVCVWGGDKHGRPAAIDCGWVALGSYSGPVGCCTFGRQLSPQLLCVVGLYLSACGCASVACELAKHSAPAVHLIGAVPGLVFTLARLALTAACGAHCRSTVGGAACMRKTPRDGTTTTTTTTV